MDTKSQNSEETKIVGRTALVTGKIGPDTLGQVTVAIREGTDTYSARSAHPDEVISVGSEVVISKFFPPRTVLVSKTTTSTKE